MDFGDIHEEQLHSQKGSEVLISFLNGVTGILNNTWLLRILVDTPLPLPHGVGECTPRHLLENDDLFITCSICRQGGWVHSSESSLLHAWHRTTGNLQSTQVFHLLHPSQPLGTCCQLCYINKLSNVCNCWGNLLSKMKEKIIS